MWWQIPIGGVVACLLWEILSTLRAILANQVLLMRAFGGRPELNSELAASQLANNEPIGGRTVIDNLVAEVACMHRRVVEMDARTAYLQSYVWECLDRREWGEMRPGAPPAEQGWYASNHRNFDVQQTQLWTRQWDLNMETSRFAANPPPPNPNDGKAQS